MYFCANMLDPFSVATSERTESRAERRDARAQTWVDKQGGWDTSQCEIS